MLTLLVTPSHRHLPSFRAALEQGWSPDNRHPEQARETLLKALDHDTDGFLRGMTDPEAKGPPIDLPNGTRFERLPSITAWMWDGEFCGSIGFRWQKGTAELPPHLLGHIGFAVVPWKRNKGYARRATREMLVAARVLGFPYVEITAAPDNTPSLRAIEAAGGVFQGTKDIIAAYGGGIVHAYRIPLN